MGGKMTGERLIPLAEAEAVAEKIVGMLVGAADAEAWMPETYMIGIAGSVRRGMSEVHDIDMVVAVDDPEVKLTLLHAIDPMAKDDIESLSVVIDEIQVDVMFVRMCSYGAAMMHFTGPWRLNVRHRRIANDKGLLLNQHGLWEPVAANADVPEDAQVYRPKSGKYKGTTFMMLAGAWEMDVYNLLGLDWLWPHERSSFM